jgi:hypothetical protein
MGTAIAPLRAVASVNVEVLNFQSKSTMNQSLLLLVFRRLSAK